MQNSEEKHVCCVCGAKAHYQMKNGKWYCTQNYRSCPGLKAIKKQRSYQKWKQLKQRGINKRRDIPLEERKLDNIKKEPDHICHYCGQHAQFQLKNGRWCCQLFCSQCPAIKKKNSEGQEKLVKKGRVAWNKGLPSPRRGQTKQTNQKIRLQGQRLHQRYASGELVRKHPFNINKNKYKNGWYKGYQCDSSWQLAFVIYNLQHNIKFERNIQGFEYQHNGQKHRYFPDFIMEDGTFVQIKGWMNQNSRIRIQTFKHPLIVIDKTKIKPYLDYALQKYGYHFTDIYDNIIPDKHK